MSKRKKPAVEAFDKEGPPNLPEGYTWCPNCKASFQGDVCPGCVDLSGAASPDPPPDHPVPPEAGGKEVDAEDELASVKSQYKSRIVSAEGRRNEYAAIINAGHQQKPVECHLVKDSTENTITLVRMDTWEIKWTRTMTAAERQRGLFPAGEAATAE